MTNPHFRTNEKNHMKEFSAKANYLRLVSTKVEHKYEMAL